MAYETWGNALYGPYGPQQPGSSTMQQSPQIQNGGFVTVPSEEAVKSYPVARGTTVTFKIEMQPYIYTKTVGHSLLDPPIIEKFRLVKESEEPSEKSNTGIDEILAELSNMKKDIATLKEDLRRRNYPDKRKGEKND